MAPATKLAYWITERGLSRQELHKRSSVPLSTLRRIEVGYHKTPPNLRHLVNIASALDVSLEELLEDEWLLPTIEGQPAGSPVQLVRAPARQRPGSQKSDVQLVTDDRFTAVVGTKRGVPQHSETDEIETAAPMLEKAAQLVRWLNSGSARAVTDGYEPDMVIAYASTHGIPLTSARLVDGLRTVIGSTWPVYSAAPGSGASIIAIIVQSGAAFHLFAP